MDMKYFIIAIVAIVIIGLGVLFLRDSFSVSNDVTEPIATTTEPVAEDETDEDTTPVKEERGDSTVIGHSVEGNDITAFHFGEGEDEIIFIGGVHGGYSWNTALVAYELIDYLKDAEADLPDNLTVTVIPVMNPDGLEKVTGTTGRFSKADVTADEATRITGRFNENKVDLNRNFECEWQSESKWQTRTVSGGDRAFSEPESRAIENYVDQVDPIAVVAWYSAAGGVYASNCENGVMAETKTLTNLYANAAGYTAHEEYDYYEITGDMVNWMASQNIPAISVLLSNHTDTEWSKNQAGVEAIINHFEK